MDAEKAALLASLCRTNGNAEEKEAERRFFTLMHARPPSPPPLPPPPFPLLHLPSLLPPSFPLLPPLRPPPPPPPFGKCGLRPRFPGPVGCARPSHPRSSALWSDLWGVLLDTSLFTLAFVFSLCPILAHLFSLSVVPYRDTFTCLKTFGRCGA